MTAAAAAPAVASVLRGMAIMTAAMAIVPGMDAIAKYLTATLPSFEIALFRFGVQFVVSGLVVLVIGRRADLMPPRFGLHMMRGFALSTSTILFFTALRVMPLTDALAIAFVEPMVLTGLSALVLKERVGWRRWLACAVGFLGAMIIVRPSLEVFGWHAALPLGSAAAFAAYHLVTRQLSGYGTMLGAQFVTGLSGMALIAVAFLVAAWIQLPGQAPVWPEAWQWPLLISIGVISLITHGMVLIAFDHAPATVLAPFGYLEIVSGTLFGYLLFGDFPHPMTWLGIALIVGSGLFIVYRERVRAAET